MKKSGEHALQAKNIILDPTEEQVFNYGLYLIDVLLHNKNRSLQDWPAMPIPQHNWQAVVGNRLIAEQLSYDNEEQTELATQIIPTLNNGQRAAFDAIVNAVETKSGQTFFLHGPGGNLCVMFFSPYYTFTPLSPNPFLLLPNHLTPRTYNYTRCRHMTHLCPYL